MSAEPTAPGTPLGPVPRRERVAALDVARGVAVLGVLLMNIWAFAGPQAFFDYPLAIADRSGNPVLTWAVIHTLFEGSQRTLLSLLFGAGALMAMQRFIATADAATARGTYYRRTGGLIVLGLINAYVFMWPADILFVYGLASLCLYPLRNARTSVLVALIVVALAVPVGLRVLDIAKLRALEASASAASARQLAGAELSDAERQAMDDWAGKLRKARPSLADEDLAAEISLMQSGTLIEVAQRQAGVSLVLQTIVAVKWWFLDALAMMMLGMVLYRAGLFTRSGPDARRTLLIAGGFAVGLPLGAWQTFTLLATDFHPVQGTVTQLSYDLRRLATALGYLGLVLVFCQAAVAPAIKAALAAVGRMALTNYLAQSMLCGFIFYGFGLGLYGRLAGYELYGIVALVWALEISWSVAWLRRFQIGPFEWAWRSVTYRRRQAWRPLPREA